MPRKRQQSRGRPKKSPDAKRTADLRIPVTAAEKETILAAVALTDRGEMASWARETLLRIAREQLSST